MGNENSSNARVSHNFDEEGEADGFAGFYSSSSGEAATPEASIRVTNPALSLTVSRANPNRALSATDLLPARAVLESVEEPETLAQLTSPDRKEMLHELKDLLKHKKLDRREARRVRRAMTTLAHQADHEPEHRGMLGRAFTHHGGGSGGCGGAAAQRPAQAQPHPDTRRRRVSLGLTCAQWGTEQIRHFRREYSSLCNHAVGLEHMRAQINGPTSYTAASDSVPVLKCVTGTTARTAQTVFAMVTRYMDKLPQSRRYDSLESLHESMGEARRVLEMLIGKVYGQGTLIDELFAQLVRQTLNNPADVSREAGWELLVVLTHTALPTDMSLYSAVRAHAARQCTRPTSVGALAMRVWQCFLPPEVPRSQFNSVRDPDASWNNTIVPQSAETRQRAIMEDSDKLQMYSLGCGVMLRNVVEVIAPEPLPASIFGVRLVDVVVLEHFKTDPSCDMAIPTRELRDTIEARRGIVPLFVRVIVNRVIALGGLRCPDSFDHVGHDRPHALEDAVGRARKAVRGAQYSYVGDMTSIKSEPGGVPCLVALLFDWLDVLEDPLWPDEFLPEAIKICHDHNVDTKSRARKLHRVVLQASRLHKMRVVTLMYLINFLAQHVQAQAQQFPGRDTPLVAITEALTPRVVNLVLLPPSGQTLAHLFVKTLILSFYTPKLMTPIVAFSMDNYEQNPQSLTDPWTGDSPAPPSPVPEYEVHEHKKFRARVTRTSTS